MQKENYFIIEKAIHYLRENFRQQPSLEETAAHVQLSPFHFQRLFSDWAGVSPKKFLQYLTVEELKKEIQHAPNLISAAEQVGLSAQSRVYDLFVSVEAVTPNEFKTKGKGIKIDFGFHSSPFGECFVAATARGICALSFIQGDKDKVIAGFSSQWKNAEIGENLSSTGNLIGQVFSTEVKQKNFNLFLKGTPFQLKVWNALLKIPFAGISTYGKIAESIGQPAASRAVGTAVGANPLAFLIPCHRVLRNEGLVGNYMWGSDRKAAILGWERAKKEGSALSEQ
jgi:AraC family transcriptional regulator, regulatory protein of adaptative response / methylated-DNA-[protein]-cysteine methyltransferase